MPAPKRDFGRFLSEVIASEIPIQFVSAVTVIFKNGKKSRLTREDLASPLPLEKNLNWNKVAEGFANVDNVEIAAVAQRILAGLPQTIADPNRAVVA